MDSGGLIDRQSGTFELENDSGGLWRTVNRVHGIQKVRGSNPLGSTKFLIQKRDWVPPVRRPNAAGFAAYRAIRTGARRVPTEQEIKLGNRGRLGPRISTAALAVPHRTGCSALCS